MKLLQIFFYWSLFFTPQNIESLSNTVLGQDVLICDDVGWWIGLNKGGDVIYSVDIGLRNIVEGKGTNNQVTPAHGAPIWSSIIVVDGGVFL